MTSIEALGMPVVLVSHRGPATFSRNGGNNTAPPGTGSGRTATRGGGGLVTALTGLADHLAESVWICAATSAEDRAVALEHGAEPVPLALTPDLHIADPQEQGPRVAIRMVEIDEAQHSDFYTVIANPLLWFIQHGLYGLATSPELTKKEHAAFDDGYVPVNARFAEAVIEQVQRHEGQVLVMLHDYHFYLVAAQVRAACPDVLLTHFTHIPWPDADAWLVLPPVLREQILRGLLGNDVVAFHTRRFARNFLMCCQELLDLHVDLESMTVRYEGREVQARWYPISVDVDAIRELAQTDAVQEDVETLTGTYLADGRQMVLRVDRTDPSKNIVRGFRAFDTMLGDHPELAGRVTFFAMLQPSRQDVPEYLDYITAIGGVVAEINAKHTAEGWQPIDLRMENDMPLAVAAYSLCDVLMVNALNDGMNLVAKEMVLVNTRNGVLALSENTGAHEELGAYALTLYPFDIQQQADALYEALTMPMQDRQHLLHEAATVVRRNDVGRWLRLQLRDVLRLPAYED